MTLDKILEEAEAKIRRHVDAGDAFTAQLRARGVRVQPDVPIREDIERLLIDMARLRERLLAWH